MTACGARPDNWREIRPDAAGRGNRRGRGPDRGSRHTPAGIPATPCGRCRYGRGSLRFSYETDPPGQQVLHHSLFDFAVLGELGFEGCDLGIHVGENGGDGGLLGHAR